MPQAVEIKNTKQKVRINTKGHYLYSHFNQGFGFLFFFIIFLVNIYGIIT